MYKTGGSICKAKSVPYIYGVRVCRKRKALARGRGFSESWQQQGLQQDIAKAGLENLQGFGRKLVNLVIKTIRARSAFSTNSGSTSSSKRFSEINPFKKQASPRQISSTCSAGVNTLLDNDCAAATV